MYSILVFFFADKNTSVQAYNQLIHFFDKLYKEGFWKDAFK